MSSTKNTAAEGPDPENRSNSAINPTSPETEERRNSAIDAVLKSVKHEDVNVQQLENAPKFVSADELPSPEEIIERLGIADWRQLEKKLVRRLDMTLVPMLWILYVFNYLDRASLGQARLSTLDQDLGLTGYQFGKAFGCEHHRAVN